MTRERVVPYNLRRLERLAIVYKAELLPHRFTSIHSHAPIPFCFITATPTVVLHIPVHTTAIRNGAGSRSRICKDGNMIRTSISVNRLITPPIELPRSILLVSPVRCGGLQHLSI